MATPSHAPAKQRRFSFKSSSERIAEIDINAYRCLEKVKAEPSNGSTFFRDCLIEWRELNTAEDFISLYEEIMPYIQTLPLLLLHKESLISKLLSRLHIKARLSLEPILRLLPGIVDSLVYLLQSGGDREPDIIEQIWKNEIPPDDSVSYLLNSAIVVLLNLRSHLLQLATAIVKHCYCCGVKL
ncbi:hypothetical protein VNO78_26260 [Psophocarpus tetragonolobus]|uniref:Uncharacterized protein n=1 Tax=Psophocarpus tetragonolobus TaxID=3891 RepID=A0AAN9RZ68_PSOTE